MKKTKAIGMFDSGVGGLSVVQEMIKQLPHENIVYFGDTARMPYGPRPQSEIRRFVFEIIEFLTEQGIKMVIMACNTSTAAALPLVRQHYDFPVLGVVEPGSQGAAEASCNGRIGVIATQGTIESGVYTRAVQKYRPDAQVFAQACPLFVPLVEAGKTDDAEVRAAARTYLAPLKAAGVDTLVLGCTHYPFLRKVIQEIMGEGVTLVDPAVDTAREAKHVLTAYHGLHDQQKEGTYRFFTSGAPEKFKTLGERFLGRPINHVSKVDLEELQLD